MRYFLDTEFYEDGKTILPISLALLCEDLRYLYVEFPFDPAQIPPDHFVSKHVLPLLHRTPDKRNVKYNDMYVTEGVPPPAHLTDGTGFIESMAGHNHPDDFPHLLERWIGKDEDPEFWAYFADYDWVLLCQRFGTMVDLPKKFPKFCMDLQQWWVQLGRPENVKPPKPEGAHDALVDARWNRVFYAALTMYQIGLKIPETGRTSMNHDQNEEPDS